MIKECEYCGNSFDFGKGSSRARHCSYQCKFLSIANQFDSKTCWDWPLSTNKISGYGQMTARIGGKTVLKTAHRLSYETFVGEIPEGLFVLHHCDNRRCFNPLHLFTGTQRDNILDMWGKGRQQAYKDQPRGDLHPSRRHPESLQRGSSHYASKINEEIAQIIRASSEKPTVLARKYGVSYSTIWKIKKGLAWKIFN
jgi:HNH endonuclease